METKTIATETYINPEASRKIADLKSKCPAEAASIGKRDAEDGLPKAKGDTLTPYLSSLLAEVQSLITELCKLHGNHQSTEISEDKLKNRLHTARNQRDVLAAKLSRAEGEYKALRSQFPGRLAYLILGLIVVLGFMEGLFLRDSVRVFLPSLTVSTMVSLVLGLSLALFAHKVHAWLQKGTTRFRRLLIRVAVWSGVSLVFYCFGLLRSYQVALARTSIGDELQGGLFDNADPTEALIYCCISLVLFIPAVWLAGFTPDKEAWKAIFRSREQKRECRKIQRQLLALQAEITKAEADLHDLKQFAYTRLKVAQADEREVMGFVELIRSAYIQANIRHRYSAGEDRPDCFDTQFHYPLRTFFQDIDELKPLRP